MKIKKTADDLPRHKFWSRVFYKAAELMDKGKAHGEDAFNLARNIIEEEDQNGEPQLVLKA